MTTVTISIASPAVVSWSSHGFQTGQALWFAPAPIVGYLPSPLLPGILYYVIADNLSADSFEIATAAGGSAINTSGAQSGVITATATTSTLNTFVPPVGPSAGTKDKPALKLKEAQFGDGYTQTTRDGLNWIREVATLTWDVLTMDQAEAINTFFKSQGGDTPFWYTLAADTTRKWTCKDWSYTRGIPAKITATLREDFSMLQ